jgi:glycosyltransferase involved in cell wall biosynthesis
MPDTMDLPSGRMRPAADLTAPAAARILVASHGHPLLAKGGGEIAAYRLFCELQARPDCAAWFLGCTREPQQRPLAQPFSEREFIYRPGEFEWFTMANRDPRFPAALVALIEELRPDVVHFHHYALFGVEAFDIVKRAAPRTKIVLTLHEYLAICAHYGQMITRKERYLCRRASQRDCARCFPEREAAMFFLREFYIKRFFERVDHFVAPSHFLMGRYIEWGIPEAKISAIANVIAEPGGGAPEAGLPQDRPLRVGFFGKLSPLKGLGVLLAAARRLEAAERRDILVEIHGDGRDQPAEWQEETEAALAQAGGNVRLCGPYDEAQVDQLMQGVDVVVVPSIWWENAPVVIEEALRNRRPVICSDIGGMAEAVRDGVDGFHFPVGDAAALAQLLERLAGAPEELARIRSRMRAPPSSAATVAQHLALYRRLLDDTVRL